MNHSELALRNMQEVAAGAALDPHVATDMIQRLGALLGAFNEHALNAEMEYNAVVNALLTSHKGKAAPARVAASVTPQYRALVNAKNLVTEHDALTNAMKYVVRTAQLDAQLSR